MEGWNDALNMLYDLDAALQAEDLNMEAVLFGRAAVDYWKDSLGVFADQLPPRETSDVDLYTPDTSWDTIEALSNHYSPRIHSTSALLVSGENYIDLSMQRQKRITFTDTEPVDYSFEHLNLSVVTPADILLGRKNGGRPQDATDIGDMYYILTHGEPAAADTTSVNRSGGARQPLPHPRAR